MGERRDTPRLAVALEVEYRVEGSAGGRRATLANLSAHSAAFVAIEPIEPGIALTRLRFELGDGGETPTMELTAEVARCRRQTGADGATEYLIAVRFTQLREHERQQMADFVLEGLAREEQALNARIVLERPVELRFERFDEFVCEVSKNLSQTGMFIASARPHPPESRFEFRLQLGDGLNLVQGLAEVVWRRETTEGPDLPSGMGIRFLSLDPTSRHVLRRLLEARPETDAPRALEGGLEAPGDPAGRVGVDRDGSPSR